MAAQVPFYKITMETKVNDFIRKMKTSTLEDAIASYNEKGDSDLLYSCSVSNDERDYMDNHGVLFVRVSSAQEKSLFPRKVSREANGKLYIFAMIKARNSDGYFFDKIIEVLEDTNHVVTLIPKDSSLSLEENIAATADKVLFPYPPEEEKPVIDLLSAIRARK